MKRKYKNLFRKGHIGSVEIRNRIIKPGAAMLYWSCEETEINPKVRHFYEAIAKGGVGLIIVESPIIDYPIGGRWTRRYRFDDDKFIEGMKQLVEVIHGYGCPTFMQMNHDGPWQTRGWAGAIRENESLCPVAASPIKVESPNDFHNELPRELKIAEIEEIIHKFITAAKRAYRAGFDGVDINASSSHLLHNFLSPFWNRRSDEYGGSLRNRCRILVEIVKGIKEALGTWFPVCVTINGVEVGRLVGVRDNMCLTVDQALSIAKILEANGVDALQVRSHWIGHHVGGFFPEALHYPEPIFPLHEFPSDYDAHHHGRGAHIPLARRIKQQVGIPIIAVGNISPRDAEKAIGKGWIDFVAMNRALIADPELPRKLAEGREEEVAPCTRCHTCLDPIGVKRCRINGALGLEEPYEIPKAQHKKKILVVGAGPAGLEAARVASLRGHDVVLIEKELRIGGNIWMTALIKGEEIEPLSKLIEYFNVQLKKLGVRIRFRTKLSPKVVKQEKPDIVILAWGCEYKANHTTNMRGKRVVTQEELLIMAKRILNIFGVRVARILTKIWLPFGRKVIIIGHGKQVYQLAEFLVKRGRNVVIVDTSKHSAEEMIQHQRVALLDWLGKKGVEIFKNARIMAINENHKKVYVTFRNEHENEITIYGESLIITQERHSKTVPNFLLERGNLQVISVGDCNNPGEIVDAIGNAHRVVRRL